jgi:hypothetical protein
MLAYAIPIAGITLAITWRRRQWRQLAVAGACGVVILGIVPLWSARTTGAWWRTPHALYTAQYLPWDVVGFGYRDTPRLRTMPPEVACLDSTFGQMHRFHRPQVLPQQMIARTWGLLDDTFDDWRHGLVFFALAAMVALPAELWFAVASCVALLAAYLLYPQDPRYTIFYLETQTTLVVLAATGVCAVAAAIGARWGRLAGESARASARRQTAWWVIGVAAFLLPVTVTVIRVTGHRHEGTDVPHRQFLDAVAALPGSYKIVFVRYPRVGACQQPEHNLIANTPPLSSARTWVVYDRGAEDAALLDVAGKRVPYLFDVGTGSLEGLEVRR